MPDDLWTLCQGQEAIAPLECNAWRVVEAQHIASTRKLVDSLQEQLILEELLENKAKPPLPQEAAFKGLHFLLSTPFRYPPLQYGSRFSTRLQRSLWYGSTQLATAFAEVAFYRLLFFKGCRATLKSNKLPLTAYQAKIKTLQGVYLEKPLFNQYTTLISCKDSYQHSQALGSKLREAGVHAFTYHSARGAAEALNIGVFTPAAFAQKTPLMDSQQTWLCYTQQAQIEFTRTSLLDKPQSLVFTQENFMVNDVFPFDPDAA